MSAAAFGLRRPLSIEMNTESIFARVAAILRALMVGAIVFLVALVIGIGVDAWVVNSEGGPSNGPVVHIRHYLLPLGGFSVMVVIVLRLALPAGRRTWRHFLNSDSTGQPIPHAARTIAWILVAAGAFGIAVCIQRMLFGFFLPP